MIVITYDICDDKRLRKVAKYLESHSIRAQKSLFELDMDYKKAKKIFEGLKEMIDKNNDKCFLFKIKTKEDIQAKTSIERIFWCMF